MLLPALDDVDLAQIAESFSTENCTLQNRVLFRAMSLTSELDQSRMLVRLNGSFGVPSRADVVGPPRRVRFVQMRLSSYERDCQSIKMFFR